MNKDVRIALTFTLGGLITLYFLDFVEVLTPGNAMKDYYYLKCLGSFALIEVLFFAIEQSIVYSVKDKTTTSKQIWWGKVRKWAWGCPVGLSNVIVSKKSYKECCKLIDKLCKDKNLNIEDKKELYETLCKIWTKFGLNKGIYTVPLDIQLKWKKAQADYKLRQLKKDF